MLGFLKSLFMFVLKTAWVLWLFLGVAYVITDTQIELALKLLGFSLFFAAPLWFFTRIIKWPKSIARVKSLKAEKESKKKAPLKHHSWVEELLQREELTKQWKELACK